MHTLTKVGTRAAAAVLITPRLPRGEPMMERNVLKPEEESCRHQAVCACRPGVGGRSRRLSMSELVKAKSKNPYKQRGRVVRGRSVCKQASLAEADLRKRKKKASSSTALAPRLLFIILHRQAWEIFSIHYTLGPSPRISFCESLCCFKWSSIVYPLSLCCRGCSSKLPVLTPVQLQRVYSIFFFLNKLTITAAPICFTRFCAMLIVRRWSDWRVVFF